MYKTFVDNLIANFWLLNPWMVMCCQSPVDTKEGGKRLIVELLAIVRKDDMRKAHTHEQLSGRKQWLISRTDMYKTMKLALCIYLEQDS